ncbi:ammonia-dependent NAD(+) synthetase [Paenalcaligenes niemegkensis]|uniref:ammonia-dependent NAD(+) synthetase n=1 Tax=Paenalcaligenes niemegkensis TaxID=2895469 RepID=UPI001EE910F5|nr:ammonia-dependent NAD(+) synthetase [Paenalcaligenes niemegkensis]MCQ9617471.1 ammonia-dependent NAD(+) synthetase [Paenalcaligenes niemegkensis]
MLSADQQRQQQHIISEFNVKPTIDPLHEVAKRVDYLASYLRNSGGRAMVLGISGGVDSLVAGSLAQRAAEQLRSQGYEASFIAMRLPYGEQADAAEADASVKFIAPDQQLVVDIKAPTDSMLKQLLDAGQRFENEAQQDFVVGNIKARQRMVAQYASAAAASGLVLGSDHAAEALMGFFTKFGDGAADVMPLAGLNKRQVRALGLAMGAPGYLVNKVPTADLESLTPMRPDEVAFGVSYDQIDDFLEGKAVDAVAFDIIVRHYRSSGHKRALPAQPGN